MPLIALVFLCSYNTSKMKIFLHSHLNIFLMSSYIKQEKIGGLEEIYRFPSLSLFAEEIEFIGLFSTSGSGH